MSMNELDQACKILRSGNEEEKETAAEWLSQASLHSPVEVTEQLLHLLDEKDEDTRWWVARVLAEVPDDSAGDLLISMLDDSDEDVKVCAIVALGERRHPRSVTRLIALLPESQGYVARQVGDALSKIGAEAVPALLKALQEGNPLVRTEAARALVRIESSQTIPALIKALDDPEPAVAHYCWKALGRMGVGETIFFQP